MWLQNLEINWYGLTLLLYIQRVFVYLQFYRDVLHINKIGKNILVFFNSPIEHSFKRRTMENMGNPCLEESDDLMTLDSKVIIDKEGTNSVMTAESTGKEQFDKCVTINVTDQSASLQQPLTKNKITPFKMNQSRKTIKTSKKMALSMQRYIVLKQRWIP